VEQAFYACGRRHKTSGFSHCGNTVQARRAKALWASVSRRPCTTKKETPGEAPGVGLACASRLHHRARQVSGHGFIRAATSLFPPCLPDRPRTTLSLPKGSEWEWKDPENESHHHAASGSSLKNIFRGELCNANNALDCIHDEPAPKGTKLLSPH
jgi:hypothetical protein